MTTNVPTRIRGYGGLTVSPTHCPDCAESGEHGLQLVSCAADCGYSRKLARLAGPRVSGYWRRDAEREVSV
jgi:hypothetical protein